MIENCTRWFTHRASTLLLKAMMLHIPSTQHCPCRRRIGKRLAYNSFLFLLGSRRCKPSLVLTTVLYSPVRIPIMDPFAGSLLVAACLVLFFPIAFCLLFLVYFVSIFQPDFAKTDAVEGWHIAPITYQNQRTKKRIPRKKRDRVKWEEERRLLEAARLEPLLDQTQKVARHPAKTEGKKLRTARDSHQESRANVSASTYTSPATAFGALPTVPLPLPH